MRSQQPRVERAVGRFNRWVDALRTSPRWGRFVSKYMTVVTYTGRRSGHTFSTPVAYKRASDVVTIGVRMPDAKNWWRNFTGEGSPISLELEGTRQAGHAVARRDQKGRVTVTVRLSGRLSG